MCPVGKCPVVKVPVGKLPVGKNPPIRYIMAGILRWLAIALEEEKITISISTILLISTVEIYRI